MSRPTVTRRSSPSRLALALLLVACLAAPLSAKPRSGKDLVKCEMLFDVAAVQPGKPFHVGVRMKVEPQWHVYWINPGDSGLATEVEFVAPEGFTVRPLDFPVPKQFMQPGDIIGYGYEDEVVFLAEVTPPADLKAGEDQRIEAKASWLVCHDVCLPGKDSLRKSLRVAEAGDEPEAANEDVFAEWKARVPTKAGWQQSDGRVVWETGGTGGTATVKWPEDVKDVELYPTADEAVALGEVKVEQVDPRTTRLTVPVEVRAGQKPQAGALPAVVGYTDSSGRRRGVEIAVPLIAQAYFDGREPSLKPAK